MRRVPRVSRSLAGAVLALSLLAAQAAQAEPDEARILSFVRDWVAAWEAQDLDDYLALYADDARVGRRDRAAHAEHKARVFARGERVSVRVGDVEVGEASREGESLIRLSLMQDYSSPSLSDFGRKELMLRSTPGGLRIVRETWSAASGRIERELASQLSASLAPPSAAASEERQVAAAPDPAEPAAEATELPPEPVFEPLEPETRTAEAEDLQPLLGEGYAPPAEALAVPPAAEDLLALEPLVREEAPAFLQPVSFPGLPGDIDERTMVEEVVARINGRVLTRSSFVERLEGGHLQLLLEQPSDLERRLDRLVPDTLMQTVERWLLVQEAEVNRAEVENFWRQRLVELRKQVGVETIDELEELLAAEGMTLTTLREQFVANEVVQQRVTSRIDRSESRLREYYEQHGADYAEPARVTLRQILVPYSNQAELDRAEAALDEALSQLADGADWCEVHAVYGLGGGCGELGSLNLDDLLPEMREVAAGLPVGAISKPIRSSAGLHVVQVRERSEVTVPPFEELAPEIEREVIDLDFNRLLEEYLQSLKETAVIEINPRYGTLWEAPGVGQ